MSRWWQGPFCSRSSTKTFSLGVCALCLEACRAHLCVLGRVWLFATPWMVASQAPLSMEFSKQKYWSGLLFSISRDLLDPAIETKSPALAVGFFTTGSPGKPLGSLPTNPCMAGDFLLFWPLYTPTSSERLCLANQFKQLPYYSNTYHLFKNSFKLSCPLICSPLYYMHEI